MPTYVYHCVSCNCETEIFHKITDDPIKKCPECNKEALQRVPAGGAGLTFKGSGFYVTDYCSKGEKTSIPNQPQESVFGKEKISENQIT